MVQSGRIPSLDGLRALAVMIVFLAHARFWVLADADVSEYFGENAVFLPARFGVTIFFFLSGYIITTLMRSEFERSHTISFKRFYLRRIYRIFPPLYIVLLIAALLTLAGLLKQEYTVPAVSAQALHMTNYYALLYSSYNFFDGTKILWSLAVEEHFYLLFPLLFLTLALRISYKQLALVLFSLCMAVLLWRIYLYYGLHVRNNWAFIATDARIDSILYGCILGVWANPINDRPLMTNRATEIVILVIAFAVLVFSSYYKVPAFEKTIMFSLQGIALFVVFSSAIRHPDWPVFRWLNWPPVVALGFISYTFYLCHPIAIILVGKYMDSVWAAYIGSFVIAVGFSTLMYHFVEKPLARKRAALNK